MRVPLAGHRREWPLDLRGGADSFLCLPRGWQRRDVALDLGALQSEVVEDPPLDAKDVPLRTLTLCSLRRPDVQTLGTMIRVIRTGVVFGTAELAAPHRADRSPRQVAEVDR